MVAVSRGRRPGSKASFVETLEDRRLLARSYGIDVSTYQPTINWTSVKNGGIDFAYVKSTEGATWTSSTFANQMAGAAAAGVPAGAYHYARYDNNSAATEAAHFLDVAGDYMAAGNLRPVVDIEQTTTQSAATVSTWVNTFCNAIVAATGVEPLVYTFASYASTKLNSTVTQWDLWMAQYPSSPAPQTGSPSSTAPWASGTWKVWQYTDSGTVSGISGSVDRNVFNGDKAAMLASLQIPAPVNFTPGQTIEVVNAPSGLKAWDTSASNGTYVTKAQGSVGTIVSGPVLAGGYYRWEVRWAGESVTRWSAQDFLAAVTTAPAAVTAVTPTNGQTFRTTAPPTLLDWTDSAKATSYDVALDGIFQANVTVSQWTLPGGLAYGGHTWSVTAKNSVGGTAGATNNFYLGKFATGDSVKVVNATSGLKAWDTAASNGTYVNKANGTTATVVSGPQFVGGYWRWGLMYAGDSVVRWSAEDWLALA